MTLFYIIRRLERQHLLDPDSEEDLFCLHHIFLPVIQTFLDEFVGSWNRHGIRTVRGNLSPSRLFTRGLSRLRLRAEQRNTQYTELEQVGLFQLAVSFRISGLKMLYSIYLGY
jgi:hypothetical protein